MLSLSAFNRLILDDAKAEVEAVSLLGVDLMRPSLPASTLQKLTADLEKAELRFKAEPENVEAGIWFGRRTAYLGRYRESIKIFSSLIERFPDEARLYRHRGHRYLTVRELDKAIADLKKAADLIEHQPDRVEPDGMPNAANIPRSTLHTNIWYHLGLAYYLKANFQAAKTCYETCLALSKNDDMLCAAAHWLYMTQRRLAMIEAAEKTLLLIQRDMEILENTAYHRLLLMYKGELTPETLFNPDDPDAINSATTGYGVANWRHYNGQKEQAQRLYRQILQGDSWPAFGYLAAEAELARDR